MLCDMCGKETKLFTTIVESTKLNVCTDCSKYGKILGLARTAQEKEEAIQKIIEEVTESEPIQMVLPNTSRIIKQKRESLGLTQEQLAKMLSEKSSIIQGIEKGRIPSMDLAKKIEKRLKIILIKEYVESHKKIKIETKAATIGSMIKFKVRKKQ